MNASDQALSINLVGKIAHLPTIFRREFSSSVADFSPWIADEVTQQQTDLTSIDVGFSFSGWQSGLRCSCLLLQIHFSAKLSDQSCRLRGIEITGHDCRGQQWHYSSFDEVMFEGDCLPTELSQEQLCHISNQIFALFGYPAALPQP